MYRIRCWILSILFLGHQLAGVNYDAVNSPFGITTLPTNAFGHEEEKTLKFLHEKPRDETEGILQVLSLSRRIRSAFTSSGILCSPMDSCVSRCGEPANLSYTCNCDALCSLFSDCCIDYENYCMLNNTTELEIHFTNISRPSCEVLYKKYNFLVVNQCPEDNGSILNRKLCTTKMPKECIFADNINVTNVYDVFEKCKETAYNLCKTKISVKCNEEIEPQCTSVIKSKCSRQASLVCDRCYTSYWPVYDTRGVIYKNSFCAVCNGQKNYTVLSPYDLSEKLKQHNVSGVNLNRSDFYIRRCTRAAIDSCPNHQSQNKMQNSCSRYLSPVCPRYNKRIIYRNVYCALCNGEKIEDLECVTNNTLMLSLIRPVMENFLIGDGQGMKLDDIPAAFSILLNFGLDGRERMYFSSEQEKEMKRHQKHCGKSKIWDPFSAVCRKLYCSTEFILEDYHCIKKETQEEEFPVETELPFLPDARAEFVHLTLSVEMELLDFLIFNGQDFESINETVRKSMANSFNINTNRIRNIHFNISFAGIEGYNDSIRFLEEMDDFHPITFYIEFDLYEDHNLTVPEPSVDSIVSMLASSLSMNGFELDIHNVTSRIFEIHQTVAPLTSWCNSSDIGEKKEYWNSEFRLILNEDIDPKLSGNQIKGIYVNKTGKFYPRGQFVADILFQGYQFSGNLINVSGVAIVCEKKKLNQSCPRILIEKHEYTLENGSLYIKNVNLSNIDTSAYERAENGSLWVCFLLRTNLKNKEIPDDIMDRVSYVLLWISVAAMAIVLLTYITFASLRNLPGCNTMNLTLSVMAMQITFLFGQRDKVTGIACKVVAHLFHYEILCCFMWMNVMAFDLFQTFGNRNILSNIRSKRKYLPRYMAYAYLSPVVIIVTASLLDIFIPDSIFSPHYGLRSGCWITQKYSAVVFFAVPLAVVMFINFFFFVLTVLAMRSVKNLLNFDSQKSQRGKSDVFLYAKMALVIGLTWTLSFVAAYVDKDSLLGEILTYLFIIFNTLQGVFIFWVFVCNKRVYELYKEAFVSLLQRIFNHVKHENSSFSISRLSNAMRRTKSNDTVVSTLSSISTSSDDSSLPPIPE